MPDTTLTRPHQISQRVTEGMTISDLIIMLMHARDKHGDLPIHFIDGHSLDMFTERVELTHIPNRGSVHMKLR